VIEWRYGDQLDWRLVVVGLSEDTSRYASHGYTPLRMASGHLRFRDRYGMPFASAPKSRLAPSSPACRAIVAARLQYPGSEWRVFRALQLANFNQGLLFDDTDAMLRVLSSVPGIDAGEVLGAIDSPEVIAEYERDKAETRTAEGSATELQGKAGNSDGKVRYTAPSVLFESSDGRRLEAGGFQPVEAYDVLVCNLDPTLDRREPPETPAPLLEYFDGGLSTQEVAALMTHGNDAPDRVAAEAALIELLGNGEAGRQPLGDDALWLSADSPALDGAASGYAAARS
jgi:protein-disulfide isomerase-like protein with CxxC motif